MVVMADRGFKHVEQHLLKSNINLVRPPTVERGVKMTKSQAKLTKQIASLRIHIERVIRRLFPSLSYTTDSGQFGFLTVALYQSARWFLTSFQTNLQLEAEIVLRTISGAVDVHRAGCVGEEYAQVLEKYLKGKNLTLLRRIDCGVTSLVKLKLNPFLQRRPRRSRRQRVDRQIARRSNLHNIKTCTDSLQITNGVVC
ncbi:hypothetical protein EVAR_23037_1 [Eumeta japonica]|uniref:DDE Tnp4 domain-containing protein n=1 Tax=Eumeta variegata TaxID=151549 RepID=A0A4C1URG8_EUMVA|nr:hypothetical protein EVAR_23037_1 [Eumeta japonica]